MTGAFLYLFTCSLRNRIRVRLRRLRQPRYLLGSIAGLLYLYFMLVRRPGGHVPREGRPTPLDVFERIGDSLQFVGTVFLFVIAATAWITPHGRPIEFTRSEVQFLFQAPVSRRQLLHYKLLRGQLGILVGSAVATVFLRPSSLAAAWTFLVGMWVLFAVVRLHLTGVALRRQSVAQHGRSGVARNWLSLTIVTAAVLVLAGTAAADWSRLSEMTWAGQVFEELRSIWERGAAAWVLWPFAVLLRLPLSGNAEGFFRALPPVLLLLAANYVWVLRADMAFEEASAADAERRAASRAAPRPHRSSKTAPFALSLAGRPETAILWKNLILLGRYATLRVLLRFVPVIVVLAVALSQAGRGGVGALVGTIGLAAVFMAVLIGPQIVRNDFRQDLASMAVLKTWPVRGAALVRGELLAPALALSVVTWMLILITAVFLDGQNISGRSFVVVGRGAVPQFAIATALLAPPLITAQLVLQNGLAILFPAWVAVGASRARGIDAMGQRLLMMAGVVLTLVLALLPAALAAGAVGLLLHLVVPAVRELMVVVPAAVAAAVMFVECWIAAELLGRAFDRTDISAVEAVE